MPKLSLMAAVGASAVIGSATCCAAQTFPSDLPMAIVCFHEQNQAWVIGYLEMVKEDGSAVYGRGQFSATLSTDRVVEPQANRVAALDCYGKSLEQLRAIGRLVELRLGE